MIPLAPEQAETLRRLSSLWEQRRFILVGATALGCWMDMRWRATADLDISIACDLTEFPCGLDREAGWRSGPQEHRWHSPDGVKLDILPAGEALLVDGSIRWRSGAVMGLTGFRLAFDQAVPRSDLAPGLTIHVPPLHVLVLLKMVSYLDRPHERERDLGDLVNVLSHGVPIDERVTEETVEAQVEFELAGAFLLGRRLAAVIATGERAVVEAFMEVLSRSDDRHRTFDRMLAAQHRGRYDHDDDHDAAALRALWDAYRRGFAGSP